MNVEIAQRSVEANRIGSSSAVNDIMAGPGLYDIVAATGEELLISFGAREDVIVVAASMNVIVMMVIVIMVVVFARSEDGIESVAERVKQ